MKIILKDLKKISSSILNQAEVLCGSEVKYYLDYYWSISLDDAYFFSSPPIESMGSLIADWEWLASILQENGLSRPLDFDRLGNVIAFLGYELFRPEEEKKGRFFSIKVADILAICLHLLDKAEDSGFEYLDVTIDLYRKFFLKEAEDILQENIPNFVIQSFVNDWQLLKQHDQNAPINAAIFEQLGRTIKVIGETISQEEVAHTEFGINFLCSQFDGMDDEDDVEGE